MKSTPPASIHFTLDAAGNLPRLESALSSKIFQRLGPEAHFAMLSDFILHILEKPRFREGVAWKKRYFSPGDVLTRSGMIGQSLFLIERGELAVVSHSDSSADESREVEVIKLCAGDLFGESSLIGSYKSIATVSALTEGEALEVDGVKLSICLDDNPEQGYLFYKYLLQIELEKLARTNRGMVDLTLNTLSPSDDD